MISSASVHCAGCVGDAGHGEPCLAAVSEDAREQASGLGCISPRRYLSLCIGSRCGGRAFAILLLCSDLYHTLGEGEKERLLRQQSSGVLQQLERG